MLQNQAAKAAVVLSKIGERSAEAAALIGVDLAALGGKLPLPLLEKARAVAASTLKSVGQGLAESAGMAFFLIRR